jgi:nitrogen fixation/metabolism regulation signal transduction histidine kinase
MKPTRIIAPPSEATRIARGLPWALGIGAAAMVAIALVLMFLLTQATNNQALYEENYARLFTINVAVAVALLLVLCWIAWRLFMRLKRGKFGSRLLIKLAAIFALVGFIPGALIYVVSYQFVSRSIESWFDVKVEGALDAGLNLGRTTLDTLANDLGQKTRIAAQQLSDSSDAGATLTLERLREQLAASDIVLWSGAGQVIASAGESRYRIQPERPGAQQLRQARSARVVTQIEGLDETTTSPSRVRALAVVSVSGLGLLTEPRYLQVTQVLPTALVSNALAVQAANREYQERALARAGLRKMYIGTLTLCLFLAMFGAVLLAVLLGNQILRPLLVLADGVAQVAAGDLRPKEALQTRDELGGLTRSFADMTQQLSDARAAVQRSMGQVDASRANLQTILDNLTAGVIVLDRYGRIRSANPGATRILRAPLAAFEGKLLQDVPGLAEFAQGVAKQFGDMQSDHSVHGPGNWQQSFELKYSNAPSGTADANAINLIARGAELPGTSRLLVFDDISEVVSAQRAQAWGEVARRLAHEIKNPLTPIQLSAERLAMKLQGKLAITDDAILHKSVKTIVDQVDAMKRLVNEFRDYARLPSADLKPLNLNALVNDVLHLYDAEHAGVPIKTELDPSCPPILGDAQQLRQVIHNLLQNAQDSTEARWLAASEASAASPAEDKEVSISTRYNPTSKRVRLLVRDSGTGFAEHILQRAFEPYVTTKARGTGLGLAVVKKIADEHGARIDLQNRPPKDLDVKMPQGAQVSLSFAVVK